MLKFFKFVIYLFGVTVAGLSFVSCTQGKIPTLSKNSTDTEDTTQYFLTDSELSQNDDFTYTIKDNAVLLKKYTGTEEDVIIPETIQNLEVRTIDARCFENNSNSHAVHTVTIPSTVCNISSLAFYNSKFLENIICDDNISYISENGILYTSDFLSLIAYPENKPDTTYIMPDTITKIYSNAFSFCNCLETVTLSPNLEIIPDYAFAYNASIQSVTATGNISHIGFAAFCKCEKLSSLHFLSSVDNINPKSVLFCNNLKSFSTTNDSSTLKDYAQYLGIVYTVSKKQ